MATYGYVYLTLLYALQVTAMAQSFPPSLDRKIGEVWEKVYEMSPQLMSDWVKCFSGSYIEAKLKSKQEIKNTVTDREYQRNPEKNFLLKLMSCNPSLRGFRYLS